jgi:hypothetical protein
MYQPYPKAGQQPESVRPAPPVSVLNAVKLMYAGAAVSLLGLIVSLVTTSGLKSAIRKRDPQYTVSQVHTAEIAALSVAVVIGLIGVGLWIFIAQASKNGKNWARITGSVFFFFNTLSLLYGLAAPEAVAAKILTIILWLVGLGAVVFLWRRESSAFFKAPQH